jgi:hypothetical protein
MKSDTQHLDFLISQYVDGSLDPSSKKSLEQTMLANPQARGLYKEHRDVQDTLDDWGNRIPLIDWDSFDKKLADRLEQETVGSERPSIFRRWARPMAAAAALFVAASVGYTWHAWTSTTITVDTPPVSAVEQHNVVVPFEVERPADKLPGHRKFAIDENIKPGTRGNVDILADSTEERANDLAKPANRAGSVQVKKGDTALDFGYGEKKSDKEPIVEPTPQFPYP